LWFGYTIAEVTCPTRYFTRLRPLFSAKCTLWLWLLSVALTWRLAKMSFCLQNYFRTNVKRRLSAGRGCGGRAVVLAFSGLSAGSARSFIWDDSVMVADNQMLRRRGDCMIYGYTRAVDPLPSPVACGCNGIVGTAIHWLSHVGVLAWAGGAAALGCCSLYQHPARWLAARSCASPRRVLRRVDIGQEHLSIIFYLLSFFAGCAC